MQSQLTSVSAVCLQSLQAPYQRDLQGLGCLQTLAERKSSHLLGAFAEPACTDLQNAVWPHSDVKADPAQASSFTSRVLKWLMPASDFGFLDDWGEALEKGWFLRKGWAPTLRLTCYAGCLKLEHMISPVISEEKPSWWGWVKAAWPYVLHKQNKGRGSVLHSTQASWQHLLNECGPHPPSSGHTSTWAGPFLSAPWGLAVLNAIQAQSTGAFHLWIIASSDTNTFLFEIYADAAPY